MRKVIFLLIAILLLPTVSLAEFAPKIWKQKTLYGVKAITPTSNNTGALYVKEITTTKMTVDNMTVQKTLNATGGIQTTELTTGSMTVTHRDGFPDIVALSDADGSNAVVLGLDTDTDLTADIYTAPICQAIVVTQAASPYTILATTGAYNYAYNNTGATDAVVFNLPASAVGMKVIFQLVETQDIDINPQATEQIYGLTNNAGDQISSDATIGHFVVLECFVAGTWQPTASSGTWSDAN